MSRPLITLTTDFGQSDGYVAAMKGVILTLCPQAVLVDISHQISPQAVLQGAYVLSTVTPYFPPGTVHLAVVDPGVGSERRAVAVQTGRALYVAPDNGLLSLALAQDPAGAWVQLDPARGWAGPGPISATFHGRDVFAPAAGRLACGAGLHDLGDSLALDSLVALPGLLPERQPDGSWLGQVIHVDHFGNLITSFRPLAVSSVESAGAPTTVHVRGVVIGYLRRTFSDVAPGELVAYVGSSGHVEVAVRNGSAAARLGAGVGDVVKVEGYSR